MKKNMVYIQSGGPTSVINSSLYGAIVEAKLHDEIGEIYGSHYGVEGLIDDDLWNLSLEDEEQIELLKQTPGSILGTTRLKLPVDIHNDVYGKIVENVKKHNIGYIFVNGGNDSMDTCSRLSILFKELHLDVKVIGVPKTIDNDLECTDHSSGFPSAAKHVINTVHDIAFDARCFKKGKVHVIEIMGRSAGWLTAAVDLLPEQTRPDLIYIPEMKFDIDDFLLKVKEIYSKYHVAVIAISEGIDIPREKTNTKLDAFGHAALEGGAAALCQIISSKLDISTRNVELSIPQRANPVFTSLVDSEEAQRAGAEAVKAAVNGETGKMVVIKRISDKPYQVEFKLDDVSKVANAIRMVPANMLYDDRRMSEAFRDYLRPLILGELQVKFENGIALLANFKKIKV